MERKNTTLTERFLKYRKSVSKKKKSTDESAYKKEKNVSVPEIIYPGELDIQEELSNLIGYSK
jgi:hypothetical protein